MTNIESYRQDDLAIDIDGDDGSVRLIWRGKSRARDPGATLGPFFDQVATEAQARGARVELVLDALEYVNSSTLAALIKGLQRFRAKSVAVEVRYDPEVGWQARTIDAMRVLEGADGLVRFSAAPPKS